MTLIVSSYKNRNVSDIQPQPFENKQPSEEKVQNEKFGGIYRFGTNVENGPVGGITLYQLYDSTALFYLDICRGAPSYN